MNREIKDIVIHCTGGSQDATPENIQKYWRRKGWKHDGYHYIIDYLGKLTCLEPPQHPSNGVRHYNKHSLNIAWIGGKYEDNRTAMQIRTLANTIRVLRAMYPDAEIKGHRDFPKVAKSCPRFDVADFIEEMDLDNNDF